MDQKVKINKVNTILGDKDFADGIGLKLLREEMILDDPVGPNCKHGCSEREHPHTHTA